MLEQARTEIDEIGVKITKTRENFNDLMKTYMLKPKKPNQQPEPKDFFDKWTSFSSEFKGTSFLSAFYRYFYRNFNLYFRSLGTRSPKVYKRSQTCRETSCPGQGRRNAKTT